MKIVIIGAGVAGFSSYLLLKQHLLQSELGLDISIKIYEAYDIHKLTSNVTPLSEAKDNEPIFTPVAIGSALGISKNGLNVLSRLDTDGTLISKLKKRGNTIHSWRMSNARGWTLANVSMSSKKSTSEKSINNQSPPETDMTVMIARQDLWEVIRDEALKDGDIVTRKKVRNIVIGDANTKSIIEFDDGTSDEADLVIGADGLRSPLRRAMFAGKTEQQTHQAQQEKGVFSWLTSLFGGKNAKVPDYITPHFEGLAGFGGFIPTSILKEDPAFDPKAMNIVFGRNGFFGYGCISSTSPSSTLNLTPGSDSNTDTGTVSAWWSTFSTPTPYPYRQTEQSKSTFNSTLALNDLQTRHKAWQNPSIQKILTHTTTTGLHAPDFYPTWTTPELPSYQCNDVAVLVGDAAHALQPSSGQGASQALEDAEVLALLLKHYLSLSLSASARGGGGFGVGDAVGKALRKYEALRMPRLRKIYERSRAMGNMKSDMGVVMEMVVYFFIWLMASMHDKYNQELIEYDLPAEVRKIVALDEDVYVNGDRGKVGK